MAQKQSELRVYCFYWSNTRSGITDAKGTTYYPPQKLMVIATNEKEAKTILKDRDKKTKEKMRNQMKGHRPDSEIERLIRKVFYRNGLCVREFPIQKGLTV